MAAGDFTGKGEQGVAVGMPNGHGLEGKVRIVLIFLYNILGFTLDLFNVDF